MIYSLLKLIATCAASLFKRILLTGFGDPIYVLPASRVPILDGGDLYLALKKAGVGVASAPETVRFEQRRSEAIKQLEASKKAKKNHGLES